MLGLALTQARAHAGRLVAAGVAVLVGTAFVAATLAVGGLLRSTVTAAVSASYAGADVVVSAGPIDEGLVERAGRADGTAAAEGRRTTYVDVQTAGRTDLVQVASTPRARALRDPVEVARGRLPDAPGEVALDEALAERLDLGVGDAVTVRWSTYAADPAAAEAAESSTRAAAPEVVGLLARRTDLTGASPELLADPADAATWSTFDEAQGPQGLGAVLVVGAPGTDPGGLRDAVARQVGSSDAVVRTAEEQTAASVDDFAGTTGLLTAVLLAFAALAVVVAGVVVTNTLAVLVAQRRRELALLRCVGATRRQVRDTVLLEAGALGLISSAAGVALGAGLAQAAATVVSRVDLGFTTPPTVPLTWPAVVVPLLVGTATAVAAALAPARAATRVLPVAALRPAVVPALGQRASWGRVAATALLVLGGGALLAGGVVLAVSDDVGGVPLGLGVLGGAVSFVGVLVGAPVLLPPVVRALGWMAGRVGGVPARLAGSNAARNPHRTAVTASALVIGVTLVTTMTVGAASVQRTFDAELDAEFPVDVLVAPSTAALELTDTSAALDPRVVTAVAGLVEDGTVEEAVALPGTLAEAGAAPGSSWSVLGLDPADVDSVLREPSLLSGLEDGTVLVPRVHRGLVQDGDSLVLTGPAGAVELTAVMTHLPVEAVVVTPADLTRLDPAAPAVGLWIDVPDRADDLAALTAVEDAVATAVGDGAAAAVTGAAVQRADIAGTIDVVLGVVLALLGVAVVIALIGVSNTLSLSVVERTRESALLRAMGLTRGQLRASLAIEGLLIAAVGVVVGLVLGTAYGWAGTTTVLGVELDERLAFPAERLALVAAVALAAGLLASVLPARRAVRTPPAAALAE